MRKFILGLFCLAATSAFGQLSVNNNQHEEELNRKTYERYVLNKIELSKVLEAKKLPAVTVSPNGVIREAMYVTPTGHIVYNVTFNSGAARTIATNRVWPGGSLGTSLTGANMNNRLGEWDGGRVLTTHQEFGGRVTQVDGATILSDHATHVAGTMVAAGVDTAARGMSYAATLKAYDWNNDDNEMIQAAQAGMLVSNHSYGNICGWNYDDGSSRWEWYGDPAVSTTEDFKFGIYNDQAQTWDDIAFTYPNYLICKAAGNDRGDNKTGSTWYYSDGTLGSGTPPPADGGAAGYDCISTYGTAKNILTVGAVEKINGGWTKVGDVVMSSFSGWGPTDDGRVKPDVVGPGVNVYSATDNSNTSYASLNGTSMATPAVSGSLLLVQQHHFARKNRYMRAATLKGLVIHTADEAGNVGPDYRFGWGLMNTASAIQFINDSNTTKLEERVLNNNQQQSIQFSADAGKPLRVTISWTDRPGTPVTSNLLDNTTKMLVNDLDIRLTRVSDGAVFNPYILNPASPAAAATTGDNVLDNVEMIHLAAPQAGNYILTVSHKGTLQGNNQAYSLLISNAVEKPLAQFSSNRTVICPGQSVNFSDQSTGIVTQRTWYFPGGSPATTNATNPTVTYANAGKYPVALKIVGGLGVDSTYVKDYIVVGGLSLPFTENFETNSPNLSKWTTQNNDAANQGLTWALATIAGTTPGNQAATVNFYNYQATGQRDALITPALDFRTHNNITLTFQHAYTRYDATSKDSLIIFASTNCGQTWTRVVGFGENGTGNWATYQSGSTFASSTEFVPASANDWCGGGTGSGCKTVPLTFFANQPSVTLRFESYNDFGNNLYIDNIMINGTLKTPVAAFDAKTTVCVGEPVTFNDRSQNIPSAWEWTFTGTNIPTSNAQNPTVTFSTPGQYAVKLKVTNTSGSDSLTLNNYITVVEAPNAPNIKANGPTQFCAGDSVLLSSDSTGNLRWYMNDILIAQNVNQIYAKQNGTYKVTKGNGTCEVGPTIPIQAGPKPERPAFTSTVLGVAFCAGGSSTLTSTVDNGNQWYRNMQAIPNANGKQYVATDSGSYTLVVTSNGCASDHSLAKVFNLLPRPGIPTITGSDNPVRGENTTYTASATGGNSYQWTITNGSFVGSNVGANVTVKFNTVDSATLTATAIGSNSCRSIPFTKRMMVSPATGLHENEWIEQVLIYPSPASSVVYIQVESLKQQQLQIRLVNTLGQVVWKQNHQAGLGSDKTTVPLHNISKGLYFVEIENESGKLVKRLLVD